MEAEELASKTTSAIGYVPCSISGRVELEATPLLTTMASSGWEKLGGTKSGDCDCDSIIVIVIVSVFSADYAVLKVL